MQTIDLNLISMEICICLPQNGEFLDLQLDKYANMIICMKMIFYHEIMTNKPLYAIGSV